MENPMMKIVLTAAIALVVVVLYDTTKKVILKGQTNG